MNTYDKMVDEEVGFNIAIYEEEIEDEEDVVEYDITSSPHDWTPSNIEELIDNRFMEVPIFQRSFVWDIKSASKLIESIILGLPVPEVFVYVDDDEESTYKIIDGQQRILSIYFFIKGRFPKNRKSRNEIKKQLIKGESLEELLGDPELFKDFKLVLSESSRYNGKMYSGLGEMQLKFRLRRYIRAISIRQNTPNNSTTSMFEIFNRLNTGGVKLTAQEIRASLYYCPYYEMIIELNNEGEWRELLNSAFLELHCKDVEFILRVFALLEQLEQYSPKMITFLNKYSEGTKQYTCEKIEYLKRIFISFLDSCSNLEKKAFFKAGKFSVSLFEAVFLTVCTPFYKQGKLVVGKIDQESFNLLKINTDFETYARSNSTSKENIMRRLEIAKNTITIKEV